MLSFMNLGGRKKRRRSKRGPAPARPPGGASAAFNAARSSMRRSQLSSDSSFLSPGAILEIGLEDKEKSDPGLGLQHVYSNPNLALPEWAGLRSADRSPEIELEFNHESLFSQLPKELLTRRKGSGSLSSMDDLLIFGKTDKKQPPLPPPKPTGPLKHVVGPAVAIRKPIPLPTHIEIPRLVPNLIATQPSGRANPSSFRLPLRNSTPLSPADSEPDPDQLSTISGMSAARDALGKTFSFSNTPGLGLEQEMAFEQLAGRDRERDDRRGSSRPKGSRTGSTERSRHRTVRQDSATLPKDLSWLEQAIIGNADDDVRLSASASRKSSVHSLRKRDFAAEQELGDALRQALMPEKSGSGNTGGPGQHLQPKPYTQRPRNLILSQPPAPTSTPGAQKLDFADQAALHRVSRIVEAPTPPASPEKRRRPQGMSKNSSSSLSTSGHANNVSSTSSHPSTSRNVATVTPPTSAGKNSKSASPTAVPSSNPSATTGAFMSKYNSVSSAARTPFTANVSNVDDEVQRMDLESFLDGFQLVTPGLTDFTNFAPRGAVSQQKGNETTPRSVVPNPRNSSLPARPRQPSSTPSVDSSFLRMRSSKKHGRKNSASTKTKIAGKSSVGSMRDNNYDDVVLDISEASNVRREASSASSAQSAGKRSTGNSTSPFQGHSQPFSSSLLLQAESIDYLADRRRPSLPQLTTNGHPGLDIEVISPSARSPDLLDMLIPNGNMVSPTSSTKLKLGRKRSGSTPNPVGLMRNNSHPYRDGNMPFTLIREGDTFDGREDGEHSPTTTATAEHRQTFPETPRAFSPILTADFLADDTYPSVLNVMNTVRESLSEQTTSNDDGILDRTSLVSPNPVLASQGQYSPSAGVESRKGGRDSYYYNSLPSPPPRPRSLPSTLNSSPPISPLELPSLPLFSPGSPIPSLSNQPFTPAPFGVVHPLPIVESVMIPSQKYAARRPPLPFGPRRPTQASLSQAPSSSGSSTAHGDSPGILGSSPGFKSAAHIALSSQAATPSFKLTPIRWRGFTYDVAQWTFTSSELQTIVSRAIRQSSNQSTVRLLTLKVLDRDLPEEVTRLEARKDEIEMNYKLRVRKRRELLQYLASLSQSQPRLKGDPFTSAARLAEDLEDITSACDHLTEELLDVSNQLAQIKQLRQLHTSSAFNMALRKLYGKYSQQVEENRSLRREVLELAAENDMAWKQAQDLAHDLDRLSGSFGDIEDIAGLEEASESVMKTSSRRSSRVSFARKSSLRASKADLRNSVRSHRSSVSSLRVNLSTGARSTFSSDVVPPVPPLPNSSRNSETLDVLSNRTSYDRRLGTGGAPASSEAEDMQRMELEIFNMLGVSDHRRLAPTSDIIRRQSLTIPPTLPDANEYLSANNPVGQHIRTSSLPQLPVSTPSMVEN